MVDRLKIFDDGNFFKKKFTQKFFFSPKKRFFRKNPGKNDELNNLEKFEFDMKIRLN